MAGGGKLARALLGDRIPNRFRQRLRTRTNIESIELPWDVAQRWIDELDRYGISAIGFMVGRRDYNEFLKAKKRFPGRLMGYINIYPNNEDAVEWVKKAGRDGFQGIKLYPSSWSDFHVYDEVCYPIYEEALKRGLLVFLHFGVTLGRQADFRYANPLDIQPPARDFPNLDFIIAHFGAGWFREVLLLQYQLNNVYMDTSGSNSWMRYLPYDLDIREIFRKAIIAGGPGKIVFGTDSTFFPRGFRYDILEEQYKAVKDLAMQSPPLLSKEEMEMIFKGNILKLTRFIPNC